MVRCADCTGLPAEKLASYDINIREFVVVFGMYDAWSGVLREIFDRSEFWRWGGRRCALGNEEMWGISIPSISCVEAPGSLLCR